MIKDLVIYSLCASFGFGTNQVLAHGDVDHDQGVVMETNTNLVVSELPIEVTNEFQLTDHYGNSVSNQSYIGRHMLVFFGYANCKNMCSISLTRIGKALEFLGEDINKLAPLIITVDPERDTLDVMRSELVKYHPSLIGHTGNDQQLTTAYQNFKQSPKSAGVDWNNEPIISHSSYIYLIDENGKLATFFPPILNSQSMAEIIGKYLNRTS